MQVDKYVFWLALREMRKALEGNIQSFAVRRMIGVEDFRNPVCTNGIPGNSFSRIPTREQFP